MYSSCTERSVFVRTHIQTHTLEAGLKPNGDSRGRESIKGGREADFPFIVMAGRQQDARPLDSLSFTPLSLFSPSVARHNKPNFDGLVSVPQQVRTARLWLPIPWRGFLPHWKDCGLWETITPLLLFGFITQQWSTASKKKARGGKRCRLWGNGKPAMLPERCTLTLFYRISWTLMDILLFWLKESWGHFVCVDNPLS